LTVVLKEAEKKVVTLQLPAPENGGVVAPVRGSAPVSTKPAPHQPQSASTAPVASTRGVPAPTQTQSGGAQHTLGWVTVGVGAAGLAVGALSGVWVADKHGSLRRDGCSDEVCQGDSFTDRVDTYNTLRTVSTTGFIVGAVGTVAGVTLLLTSPKRDKTPSVGVTMAPNLFSVQGAF
jgi:hypothetical protein